MTSSDLHCTYSCWGLKPAGIANNHIWINYSRNVFVKFPLYGTLWVYQYTIFIVTVYLKISFGDVTMVNYTYSNHVVMAYYEYLIMHKLKYSHHGSCHYNQCCIIKLIYYSPITSVITSSHKCCFTEFFLHYVLLLSMYHHKALGRFMLDMPAE